MPCREQRSGAAEQSGGRESPPLSGVNARPAGKEGFPRARDEANQACLPRPGQEPEPGTPSSYDPPAAPKTAWQDPSRLLLRYRRRRQAHPKVNPILSSPSQHAPHQVRKSHKTPPPITTEQAVTQHHHADSHAQSRRLINFTSQACSRQGTRTPSSLSQTHVHRSF